MHSWLQWGIWGVNYLPERCACTVTQFINTPALSGSLALDPPLSSSPAYLRYTHTHTHTPYSQTPHKYTNTHSHKCTPSHAQLLIHSNTQCDINTLCAEVYYCDISHSQAISASRTKVNDSHISMCAQHSPHTHTLVRTVCVHHVRNTSLSL